MPELRVVKTKYGIGGYDPTKPNNNVIEEITAKISDKQLADEAEQRAMTKAEELIDGISSLNQAKEFLKRLVARLMKNGSLP